MLNRWGRGTSSLEDSCGLSMYTCTITCRGYKGLPYRRVIWAHLPMNTRSHHCIHKDGSGRLGGQRQGCIYTSGSVIAQLEVEANCRLGTHPSVSVTQAEPPAWGVFPPYALPLRGHTRHTDLFQKIIYKMPSSVFSTGFSSLRDTRAGAPSAQMLGQAIVG